MSEEAQGAASHAKQAAAEGAVLPDIAPLHDAVTTLSPAATHQVTGSAGSEPAKWRCDACTYENYPQSRKCTMCRAARPALAERILRPEGASALPPDPADAEAERLRPLRIASPAGQSGADKWPCATCTYENWPKALKCAMCGAAAAGAGALERLWLQACLGVLEGSARCVDAYLAAGGDPARALTPPEVALLNRASAFDAGHTLVHLAIRFRRQDILAALLARISGGGPGLKRSPSYVAPDLAAAIRRHVAGRVRAEAGPFPCRYLDEFCTFTLPRGVEELPPAVREQLFAELLDRDAQQTLEAEPALINWSAELSERLGSRLYALWNRSAGDCLPDAALQAAAGVFDRDNTLRGALADTLASAARPLFARWAAWERAQAAQLHYAPDDAQLRAEWARLAAAAARAGAPLHQLHVFVLAHVLRRPLIVYGVDVVNSFRGEALGYARFRGVYLPLLWEPSFCSKSPLCLGYTRGHFSALVPLERRARRDYICDDARDAALLPLTDADGELLPVPFLARDEAAQPERVLRRWLRALVTRGGVLAARQTAHARPLLQAQMLEEWLNHYRRLAQQARGPFPPRLAAPDAPGERDADAE